MGSDNTINDFKPGDSVQAIYGTIKMESQNQELKQQLKKAMGATILLWNTICEIDADCLHKMDRQEFCTDIHNIQNRLFTIAYKNVEFID